MKMREEEVVSSSEITMYLRAHTASRRCCGRRDGGAAAGSLPLPRPPPPFRAGGGGGALEHAPRQRVRVQHVGEQLCDVAQLVCLEAVDHRVLLGKELVEADLA